MAISKITKQLKELSWTFLLTGLLACGQEGRNRLLTIPSGQNQPGKLSVNQSPRKNDRISTFLSQKNLSIWNSGKLNTSARFHFGHSPDTVLIEYYPECWGSYPLAAKGDTLFAFWNTNVDTKYHFDVAKIIKSQQEGRGMPFLAFTLSSDSTLGVLYMNTRLVNKINGVNKNRKFWPQKLAMVQ